MALIIYKGWIIIHQYKDNGPFAFRAYCENDPESTAHGSSLDEIKAEINEKIEDRKLKTA